jgi:uncharacterized protein (DUF1330 family)
MTAYLIVHRRRITDPDQLKKYREGVKESIAKFNGQAIVRSDGFEVLEGEWHPGRSDDDSQPERVTVIEFPDMAALKRWYESDDYAELKAIRQASAECDVVAVEGSRPAASR